MTDPPDVEAIACDPLDAHPIEARVETAAHAVAEWPLSHSIWATRYARDASALLDELAAAEEFKQTAVEADRQWYEKWAKTERTARRYREALEELKDAAREYVAMVAGWFDFTDTDAYDELNAALVHADRAVSEPTDG